MTIFLVASIHSVVGRFVYYDSSMTWSAANQYCIDNHGSTLATITSDAEAEEIRNMIESNTRTSSAWIGLNDINSEGTWVWASGYSCDGGNCDDLSYWRDGEPNNSLNKEDCGIFFGASQFNDGDCENSSPTIGFICDAFSFKSPTAVPTKSPTDSPTKAPSASPSPAPTTGNPTAAPSLSPTTSPTMAPSRCDAKDMYPVTWHDMLNEDDSANDLVHELDIEFDASTLSLIFSASLEYVGLSADGNFNDEFELGTSYYIDFQSFSEIDGGIDKPGTCANRNKADYSGKSFGQFWTYPVDPETLDAVATADRMAYPPSEWTLNADGCNEVVYKRTLSWADLTSCADADGDALISVTQTDGEDGQVLLEGTLFVEVVSPYSMTTDGYYRTFPLVQQDFRIAVSRRVDVLASTGVQLFISSVMAYGMDENGNYELTMLTQAADYVKFGDSVTAMASPVTITSVATETGSDCLVASAFTCAQIFKVTIPGQCPAVDEVDLSGKYQFGFTAECQEVDDDACDVFMGTLDTDKKVVLDIDASFVDGCDVQLFDVSFGANLTFYTDEALTVEADGSVPFVIGQDTIYGKVTVGIPDDEAFDFLAVSIQNVYVCTAADTLAVDSSAGTGGCFSSNIDADGPYTVIGTGADAQYQGSTDFTVDANDEAAFSFLTFATARETINVHVQVLITMTTDQGTTRRRMLLQSTAGDEGNAFRSFIGSATVQEAATTADPVETDGASLVSVAYALMTMMIVSIAWI